MTAAFDERREIDDGKFLKIEPIIEDFRQAEIKLNQLISVSEVLVKLIELRATSIKLSRKPLKHKLKIKFKFKKVENPEKPIHAAVAEPLLDLARSVQSHCLENCQKQLTELWYAEISSSEKFKRFQRIKSEIDLVHRKLNTLFDHSIIPISMRGKCAHIIMPKIGHTEYREEAASNSTMIISLLKSIQHFVDREDSLTNSGSEIEQNLEPVDVGKLLAMDILDDRADAIIGAMTAIELRRLRIEELFFEDQKRKKETIRTAAIYILLIAVCIFFVPSIAILINPDFFSVRPNIRNTWPLLGIPSSVILWSFLGSFSATIHRFNRNSVYYFDDFVKWMLTRHVQGIVLSSAFYLILTSGLFLISGSPQTSAQGIVENKIVLVLCFLIGFSDRFVDTVFETLIDKYAKKDSTSTQAQNSTTKD